MIFSHRRQAIQEAGQEVSGEPGARLNRLTWDENGLGLIDSRAGNVMIPRPWPAESGYAGVFHPSSQHHDHQLKICWSRRQRQCQFHRRPLVTHSAIPAARPRSKSGSCSSRARRAAYPRSAGCAPPSTEAATVIKQVVFQFTFDGFEYTEITA